MKVSKHTIQQTLDLLDEAATEADAEETYTLTAQGRWALENSVYIGRGTAWGNPYRMHSEADRDRVCDLFERYARERLAREPRWLDPLRGKVLVCHCAPRRCHADTLLRLLEEQGEV